MNANELNVPLATLAGSFNSNSVAFHPTARLLATGQDTVNLWRLSADYSSATCVATLKAGRGEVTSLGFDPTGTVLATAGHNGTKLWDCRQFHRRTKRLCSRQSQRCRCRWWRCCLMPLNYLFGCNHI